MTSHNCLRMSRNFATARLGFTPLFTALCWLLAEQTASAQVLIAQTGTAKTAVGWLIVLLCIGLGLLVVCRPSGREGILQVLKLKKKK